MAASEHGARLTEAHRLAQGNLVGETMKDVLAAWRALDPADLDRTFPAYARIVEAILDARRSQSASLSAAYLRAFREAEGVGGDVRVSLAKALPREQALTSLLVTGPVAVKVGVRSGKPVEAATESALVQTLGAVARHVQNGGRETIHETVLGDEKAYGIARVSDGSPCAFCAMLVGRGAVYRDEMTASFEAHDKCGCTAEPIYRPNAALPGVHAQRFADLYQESTAGLSGDEARAAFRKAYAAQA